MTIKAIETVYNGYRFRSRLEARWAIFFDSLGIPYEYEAEGYPLGIEGCYLPDFWIPGTSCFLEVKPLLEPFGESLPKLAKLSEVSGRVVIQIMGSPGPCLEYALSVYVGGKLISAEHPLHFGIFDCEGNEQGLAVHYAQREIIIPVYRPAPEVADEEGSVTMSCDGPRLKDAYNAARSARFEHGETP